MKKLSKILTVGALALSSLPGCIETYHINGEALRYSPYQARQLVVGRENELVKYYVTSNWNSSKHAKKDVKMITVFEKKGFFPRILSGTEKEDSLEFNKEVKKYYDYLSKIDSIENSKPIK